MVVVAGNISVGAVYVFFFIFLFGEMFWKIFFPTEGPIATVYRWYCALVLSVHADYFLVTSCQVPPANEVSNLNGIFLVKYNKIRTTS